LTVMGTTRAPREPLALPEKGAAVGGTGLGRDGLVVQGIAEDAARQRAGMAPVFEQHLTIDNRVVDALGELPDTPTACWEVVHRVLRQRVDGVGIEDRDVGRQARTEQASVIDAK